MPRIPNQAWSESLKSYARSIGFENVGIADAVPADGFSHLQNWLELGYAGEMAYMARHQEARKHPESILSDVKTVVMVTMSYKPALETFPPPGNTGRVARYASGNDYHDVFREKLNRLLHWVQQEIPGTHGRGIVDTAPLLERDFARRAGLGWFGKNTMLMNRKWGSYFLLGALLLDLEIQSDPPFATQHCGTCTRCLDACPTDAFVGPYQLDARKCISYLTIELRGSIPEEHRPGLGNWIFGCDICQEVCPWNRKASAGTDPDLLTPRAGLWLDLNEILSLTDAEFRKRFRHTPLFRTKRQGVVRNAAIVAGNLRDPSAIASLEKLAVDEDAVVRDAAKWALEQFRSKAITENVESRGTDQGFASA